MLGLICVPSTFPIAALAIPHPSDAASEDA